MLADGLEMFCFIPVSTLKSVVQCHCLCLNPECVHCLLLPLGFHLSQWKMIFDMQLWVVLVILSHM